MILSVSGPKTSLIACRQAAFSHYVIIGFRDRNPRIKYDAGGGPETRVSLGVA